MEFTSGTHGLLRRLLVCDSQKLYSLLKPMSLAGAFSLFFLGLSAANGAAASAGVGGISGTAGVSASGAATYNIPISIPAGTNGMQPSISLAYDSQSGEGLAGYGWTVTGFSIIARCPHNIEDNGATQAIQFTGPGSSSDDFCLDGQRLRLISGSYGANAAVYGTEIEQFSKIVSSTDGNATNGPSYFTVQMKDGRSYEYGNTTDSKIYANGTKVVRVWALDKVTDANGNYISYTYHPETSDGTIGP